MSMVKSKQVILSLPSNSVAVCPLQDVRIVCRSIGYGEVRVVVHPEVAWPGLV